MAALALGLSSCHLGNDNQVGPQGPAGNANVQSLTYSIKPSEWTKRDLGTMGYVWDHKYTSYLVNQDIVNYGAVIFYMKDTGGDNAWSALPSTFVFSVRDSADPGGLITYHESYDAWYSLNQLQVTYRNQFRDGQYPPNYVVTIKALVIADSPYYLNMQSVNLKNYEEAKRVLGFGD